MMPVDGVVDGIARSPRSFFQLSPASDETGICCWKSRLLESRSL